MSETENNPQEQNPKMSKLAVWSITLGLIGFLFQCIGSIPVLLCGTGLIFGIIALRKITKSGGLLTGRGFAIAGLVISVLGSFLPALTVVDYIEFFRKAQIVKIDDVTSKTTLRLLADDDPNFIPLGISIMVTGRIDGSANIYIRTEEGTKLYPRHITTGLVFVEMRGDWYTNDCLLEYYPEDVNSGHLTIRYAFRDFWFY